MRFYDVIDAKIKKIKKKIRILLIDNDPIIDEVINYFKEQTNIELYKFVNIKQYYEKFLTDKKEFYYYLRKGKESYEQIDELFDKFDDLYSSFILLKKGFFDGIVGGFTYKSADFIRASLRVIGLKENNKRLSSMMILTKENETLFFSDPSVNIECSSDILYHIGKNHLDFLNNINIKSNLAFLSYSTYGSIKNEETIGIFEASLKLQQQFYDNKIIGEVQFDAAFDNEVRSKKIKNQNLSEYKFDSFVFPDLNSANIGYKLVQYLGHYDAFGPILLGLNQPANDLSRGAKIKDIIYTIYITALQIGDDDE